MGEPWASWVVMAGRNLVSLATPYALCITIRMALLRIPPSGALRSPTYLRPCCHLKETDAVLRVLIDRIGACQLRPRREYFATLCDSIISQQLSPRAAGTIYDRFVALYPRRRPTPTAVSRTSFAKLRAVGLSPQKAGYVKDLAAGFCDGRITPRRFNALPNEDVIATLSSIKGIGRWTAEMFLIFSLNRLNVLPVGDLGIQKAVQRWYGLSRLPTPTKLRALAKRWHPYESLACWYLWHSTRL